MYLYTYIGSELVETVFLNQHHSLYDIGLSILELMDKFGDNAIVIVSKKMIKV